MATVDGVLTAPDSHGVIQGNGGEQDRLAGGSGNDRLQGHAAVNQYYGGAGNDTFIFSHKFAIESGAHQGQSLAAGDQYAYVTDFAGAGQAGGDFITFSGKEWDASSLTLQQTGTSGTPGAALYYYTIADTDGHVFNFAVNSLSGKALGAGDFNFY